MPPGSSCPSRASGRAAPGTGSRRPRPTRSGSRTSPTGASPTGAGSRSAAGSTTTPGTCSGAPCSGGSRGDDVVTTFTSAGDAQGWPAATLTDNGTVYTARFVGGRNGLEHLLAYLGIRQKNGVAGPPPDPGQDRALPPDPQALARTAARGPGHRGSSRPSSTPSARPTTSSGRTGRSAVGPRARHTGRTRRTSRPAPPAGATSGCAMTPPTRRARSPSGGPGGCTTSGSARPTPAAGSSPSSASRRSRSSPSTPARSSRRHRIEPERGLLAQHATRPRPMAGVSTTG